LLSGEETIWASRKGTIHYAPPGGRAEGHSPFAEGLGVSPNSLFILPQEWGTKGVESEYGDGAAPDGGLVEYAFVEQPDEFLVAHAQDLSVDVFVVLAEARSGHTRLAGSLRQSKRRHQVAMGADLRMV
jgi:hypothetical protein